MKTNHPKDADGKEIHVGTVLRQIHDGDRGVVVRIVKAGDKGHPGLDCVGDLNISSGPGRTRVTNRYSEWKRIPEAEQTYLERFTSWQHSDSFYEPEYTQRSKDEYEAVRGILALLPPGIVDYDYHNPSTTCEALYIMAQHLEALEVIRRHMEAAQPFLGAALLAQEQLEALMKPEVRAFRQWCAEQACQQPKA